MNILLTGCEGFVGTHLRDELEAHGHTVIGSDKGDHDLAEPGRAEHLIGEARPDYVVHLAARYGRLLCRDEPHRAVSDNAASTTELAAVCADRDIPLLYTSTSEVYGDHGEDTITEESELRTPTTIYGLSKRWGEEALRLYLPPEKLTIVRLNMLMGDGQIGGYGRCSLATFVKNTVQGQPYCVHRDATRSWLYVGDAARGLRLLIEGGHTGTFNLSNPAKPIPMTTVADMVGGEYEIADAPLGQIRHKNYDCSKLLETIDWRPEVSLGDAIARTMTWARDYYRAAS